MSEELREAIEWARAYLDSPNTPCLWKQCAVSADDLRTLLSAAERLEEVLGVLARGRPGLPTTHEERPEGVSEWVEAVSSGSVTADPVLARVAGYVLELEDRLREQLWATTHEEPPQTRIRVVAQGEQPPRDGLVCNFCGTAAGEAQQLIVGPLVHICGECVGVCVEALREADEEPTDTPGGLPAPERTPVQEDLAALVQILQRRCLGEVLEEWTDIDTPRTQEPTDTPGVDCRGEVWVDLPPNGSRLESLLERLCAALEARHG